MFVITTGNESRSPRSADLEVQYREIQELRKKLAEEEAKNSGKQTASEDKSNSKQ